MLTESSGFRWIRFGAILGSAALYILTFAPLYQVLGHQMSVLLALPVILAAWFYGLPIGLSVSVLLWLVSMMLLHSVRVGDWMVAFREASEVGLTLIFVAIVIGRLSSVGNALRQKITQHQQTDKALRESEARFRSLVETAPGGILLANRRGTIQFSNKQLERLFGYPSEELVGLSIERLLPERFRKGHEVLRDGYFGKPDVRLMGKGRDLVGLRKDGTEFPVEIGLNYVQTEDGPMTLAFITDITDRKQIESQRLELTLAEEKAGFLKEFLATVSHDLKTPLSVINATTYLLERLTDPEEQKHRLGVIKAQTVHLGKLIEDILMMSQLDTLPELEFHAVDVNKLVQNMVSGIRPIAEKKQLSVNLNLTNNLPAVRAEEDSLNRALVNLVENALNYTPPGGVITVQTSIQETDIIVETRDTGIGISETELPHIFERFYRADTARSSHTGGTGLGLAIVKKIIEIHGGRIEVTSAPGVGTTFWVRLPVVH